ncbi:hypothetical protein JOH51_007177 [Rhizobium leguminosarum]|nr:hypothetical protein [Rhizobium leguminosarum]
MDDLGLVRTVDRFGESVVVGISDASDGGLDPDLCQSFRILDGHVLNASIRMMNKTAAVDGSPIVESLFQGIEYEAGLGGSACPPADDAACERIDDEGHVNEALPSRHIREIGKPQHIRPRCAKLAVYAVERAWSRLVADRRADRLSTDNTLEGDVTLSAA